jgi:hypothetical protein
LILFWISYFKAFIEAVKRGPGTVTILFSIVSKKIYSFCQQPSSGIFLPCRFFNGLSCFSVFFFSFLAFPCCLHLLKKSYRRPLVESIFFFLLTKKKEQRSHNRYSTINPVTIQQQTTSPPFFLQAAYLLQQGIKKECEQDSFFFFCLRFPFFVKFPYGWQFDA